VSPLTTLWVASVIGAALFFASGVFSAELLLSFFGVKAQPALSQVHEAEQRAADERRARVAALAANDDRWRSDVARVESLAQTHRFEAEALRQRLEDEVATKAAIDHELQQTRALADDSARRLAETQKSASLVPTLKRRLEEVEHAQATRARSAQQSEEKHRSIDRELAHARGEITRLEAQLATRVGVQTTLLESDVRRLNDDQQARSMRVKMLSDRVAELEAYAEENAVLRGERAALQSEVDRLRRATPDAPTPAASPSRVHVDPVGMATITRPGQSGMTRRVQESENTLEASLKQHLAGLLAREPGVIAVLSDENGFPVAGIGSDQQQEGMSVLTSLAQQLAFRVKEFVDLERIERLEIADGAGRALRVRLFDWEAQPLALACLGKRSLVENPDEELVVTAFPRLLRKVWSA
jgi:hypothetical protein